MGAYDVDLFLTTNIEDAQRVIDGRTCAAAIVKDPPKDLAKIPEGQVRIAFDGDLGGLEKSKILKAFKAHIFFDDQELHLEEASKYVPSGKVPYHSSSPLYETKKIQ